MNNFSVKSSAANEKGIIMVVILFLMSLLLTLGVGILSMTNINFMVAGNKRCERAAFHAAESGLEEGVYSVFNVFDSLGVFNNDKLGIPLDMDQDGVPDNLNGFTVSYDITRAKDANGNVLKPFLYQTMMNGAPAFHTAWEYEVVSTASAASIGTCRGGNYSKIVRERFRVVETPLVQYFIFNNVGRQEIAPGSNMHMWGRIHGNYDICLAPNGIWQYYMNYSWNYNTNTPNTDWAPDIMTTAGHIWSGCCPGRPWGATGCASAGNGVTYVKIVEPPNGWPPNIPTLSDGTLPGTTPTDGECNGTNYCLWIPAGQPVADTTINALPSNGKIVAGAPKASPPSAQALKRNKPGATPGQSGYGFYEYVAGYPLRDVDGIAIVGTGALGSTGTRVYVSHRDPLNSSNNFDNREVTSLLATGDGIGEVATGVNSVHSQASGLSTSRQIIWENLSKFTDGRSSRPVDLTQVNMERLEYWYCDYLDYMKNGSQTLCNTESGRSQIFATGGLLVFISRSPVPPTAPQAANSSANLQAIRLDNETRDEIIVKSSAVSDNPMYIMGDRTNSGFNAASGKWHGFAAVADSITLLSRTFADGTTPYSSATPVKSEFDVALFGGEIPDTAHNSRTGGVENFARLLENWGGGSVKLTITGCFIALRKDQQNDAVWLYGSPAYQLPDRYFGWETRFGNPDNWPPYVPSIFNVERVSWFEG